MVWWMHSESFTISILANTYDHERAEVRQFSAVTQWMATKTYESVFHMEWKHQG